MKKWMILIAFISAFTATAFAGDEGKKSEYSLYYVTWKADSLMHGASYIKMYNNLDENTVEFIEALKKAIKHDNMVYNVYPITWHKLNCANKQNKLR